MLHLIELVVGPLPVEAEHRDAELVDHVRVDLRIALLVRDLLAAPGETDRRAVVAAVVLLELRPVAAGTGESLDATAEAVRRLPQPTIDFDVIPAREVELLVIEPPGHVHVHAADAVLVVRDVIDHRRDETAGVGAGGVGDVLADDAARVREPLRKER